LRSGRAARALADLAATVAEQAELEANNEADRASAREGLAAVGAVTARHAP
jgi:hypothetical protein